MARPKRYNADYFSHDNDMRNHRKIKALRGKFGVTGYAFWCMFLEYLTYCDYNHFDFNDSEVELMSGDFGISVTEIHDILHYCIKLELLLHQNGFVRSISLDERLESVYKKRNRQNEFLSQKPHNKDTFRHRNAYNDGVSVTESTQSKVKEIKVNNDDVISDDNPQEFAAKYIEERKLNSLLRYKEFATVLLSDVTFAEKLFLMGVQQKELLTEWLKVHIKNCIYEYDFTKTEKDFKSHFLNWIVTCPNYANETNPSNHLKENKAVKQTPTTTQHIPADQKFRPFVNPVQKQE
jgi:hypothetical protein